MTTKYADYPIDRDTITFDALAFDGNLRASRANPTTPVKLVRVSPDTDDEVLALAGPGDDVLGYLVCVMGDGIAEVELQDAPQQPPVETVLPHRPLREVASTVEILARPLEDRYLAFLQMARDHYALLRAKSVPEVQAIEAALQFTTLILRPEISLVLSPHDPAAAHEPFLYSTREPVTPAQREHIDQPTEDLRPWPAR